MITMITHKYQFGVQFACLAGALIAIAALAGKFPSTELIAGVFVLVFVFTANGRKFLIEFAPFLMLLVAYKWARNFADDLTVHQVNVENLIEWERNLFGGAMPGHTLQTHLWNRPFTPVLDLITNTLYLSHFISPLVMAVLLWRRGRAQYWAFAIGLITVSYAAFGTYILFPAAPPWWATHFGYLPDQPVVLDHFVVGSKALIDGANPVAAMPSLHTAYPTFIALVALATWGRRAIPVILLPVSVAFSTFYLGHHYVIDALMGAFYSLVVFLTVFPWAKRFTESRSALAGRPRLGGQPQHNA
ncbi:MAG: inositol phosphorylceramide synthase [Anaerolineae bacterium]|nr:inositol phosphorylceramide synthase [Anaerolineae bacterium]